MPVWIGEGCYLWVQRSTWDIVCWLFLTLKAKAGALYVGLLELVSVRVRLVTAKTLIEVTCRILTTLYLLQVRLVGGALRHGL